MQPHNKPYKFRGRVNDVGSILFLNSYCSEKVSRRYLAIHEEIHPELYKVVSTFDEQFITVLVWFKNGIPLVKSTGVNANDEAFDEHSILDIKIYEL